MIFQKRMEKLLLRKKGFKMTQTNYMQVLPFDEKRQRKIYKKLPKKQLIDFLIQRDKVEEGMKEKVIINPITTTSAPHRVSTE